MKISPPALKREIKPRIAWAVVKDNFILPQDVVSSLQTWMNEHHLTYLLAHADDGVIWGKRVEQSLVTSYEVAQAYSDLGNHFVPLRIETLQQARLFSDKGELYLWKDGIGVWHSRLIFDDDRVEKPDFTESIDEYHLLWGDHADYLDQVAWGDEILSLEDGFSLMSDGVEGLQHIVPIPTQSGSKQGDRPVRLLVRHYLTENDIGAVQIAASRMVDLVAIYNNQKD